MPNRAQNILAGPGGVLRSWNYNSAQLSCAQLIYGGGTPRPASSSYLPAAVRHHRAGPSFALGKRCRLQVADGAQGCRGEHPDAEAQRALVQDVVAAVEVVILAAGRFGAKAHHGTGKFGEEPGKVLAAHGLGCQDHGALADFSTGGRFD